ncbi:hypothetical protein C7212DRAFT_347551 [Tuber magnatum]|uniref:Uncharacterized protein n=1 Tax=Tuber magnatum TaxID=42249 RepID=A0A317SG48_9PEZI|nr:hypothetical protein C7212DRAFT_347551 [Tuber magnatum]
MSAGAPPSMPLTLAKGRRQRGRDGSVINPSPPVPPPPPPHSSSSSSSFSSPFPLAPTSEAPPQNIREDGYIYLQIEIGFDREIPVPWASKNESPTGFCLKPRPENVGKKYFLPGPHKYCERYYASCDHRSYESFVMYNMSAVHEIVASFVVVVPLLLENRPCRTLNLVGDAIKRAFPEADNLENYNEINLRIGVEATSTRICTLRQLRRIFMGIVLLGETMLEFGAFTLKAPVLGDTLDDQSPEDLYAFMVHLDDCYEVGGILAFFQEGGMGAGLPLGKYWQGTGSLSTSGSLDLICYTTFIQHIVVCATIERCIMFLWTAMHTPAERYMTWARCGISQSELNRFGCGHYGQASANDLEPHRGWKTEGDAVMEWEEEEEVTSEYLTEDEEEMHVGYGYDECEVEYIEYADGDGAESAEVSP